MKKPIARALSWRVMGTSITFILVYLFSGKIEIAAFVAGAEFLIKLAVYHFHERAWDKLSPRMNGRPAFVLWFTGLSGSGKSTLADRIYTYLTKRGYRVERLDGDTIRSIFPNTGFTREERDSHVKRVGYLASILEKNGIIVISSLVSPYIESRDFVRSRCARFIEIYTAASLEECERRDVKGLYKKARAGEIKRFTGIDDPYEPPVDPEICIDTGKRSIDESTAEIISCIKPYL
jgi:adenylylsulfate kinase